VRVRQVGDVVRRRFIALSPGDSLLDAERLMRIARVRYLPVVSGATLVGVLSNRDLLESSVEPSRTSPEALGRFLLETRVAELMNANPKVVTPDSPLAEAARLLLESGEGCLPVVDARGPAPRLLGIVTENDLLRAAYEPRPEGRGRPEATPAPAPRRGAAPQDR
jgi:CBS domain-containing membrane protein